jgi:hypothetical protein
MPSVREILQDVAEGRLDPQTAAQLLEASPEHAPQASASTAPPGPSAPFSGPRAPTGSAPHAPAGGTGGDDTAARPSSPVTSDLSTAVEVSRLALRLASYKVRLVADPSVATLVVDGPHSLHSEGQTLVLTGEPSGRLADGAYVMRNPGPSWRDLTTWFRAWDERVVTVRVRPDLPVEVDLTAGSLHSDGAALVKVRVAAGSAKVLAATAPLDLLVQAGSASIEARPTSGVWRLRAESGSLNLRLAPDSDVRLRAEAQMGKVSGLGSTGDLVLGAGTARADLEVVMGQAAVLVAAPAGAR